MSKFFSTIKKSFLVLLRNRLSSFAIICGPLIVMLLLGLAFTSPTSYVVSAGYFAPDDSELTQRFIQNMEDQGLIVSEYNNTEECTQQIKYGRLEVCVEFPEKFSVENNKTNVVKFFVDDSRTNFVYRIIDTVSSNIGVESTKLSKDLTNTILSMLWSTESGIDEAIALVIKLKPQLQDADGSAGSIGNTLDEQNLSKTEVDTSELENEFNELRDIIDDLVDETDTLISDGQKLIDDLQVEPYTGLVDLNSFDTALTDLVKIKNDAEDNEKSTTSDYTEALQVVNNELDNLYTQLEANGQVREEAKQQINSLQVKLDEILAELDVVKAHLESLNIKIKNLKITSSDTITTPIITEVNPVAGRANNLVYTYPYLLMVVTLFVGLLLSSTLIIMEKRAKSAFRRFITPNGESLFFFANFVTSLCVLLVQYAFILGASYYFLGSALFSNATVFLAILASATILFILLGMIIGYFFNTQEAATMASISIGSIAIFFSNLVLPIETLSPKLQELSLLNPYVLTSEAIRKTLLFSAGFRELQAEFITLGSMILILFVIAFIIKDVAKSKFLLHLVLAKRSKHAERYLQLGEEYMKDVSDLLGWLKRVDEKTFKEQLHWKEVRKWLKHEQGYRKLRVQLVGKNKEQMIIVIEKHLKRNT